jgi:hypothetical protein
MIAAGLWELPASYISDPALLMAALAALGFGVGILTGIFGVGGGFLVTPLLVSLYGVPASTAVGSDLCFIVGTSAAGLRRNMRLGNYEPLTMIVLGLAGMLGAVGGSGLHEHLKASLGADRFDVLIQLLYLPMLLTTAYLVYRNPGAAEGKRSLLQRLPLRPGLYLKRADLDDVSLIGMIGLGLVVGMVTGLMGVGGGVLYMPLLLVVVGLTPHQAVGTSLGLVFFNASAGVVAHGSAGNVSMIVALSLLVTSTIGVQIGVWVCHTLHATRLRKYFALIVLAAVAVVVVKLVLKLTG